MIAYLVAAWLSAIAPAPTNETDQMIEQLQNFQLSDPPHTYWPSNGVMVAYSMIA